MSPIDPRRLRHAFGLMSAVGILSLLAAPGCGYALSGAGTGVIPEHVKVVVVSPFENRTNRPEIEQRVTEKVASEFSRRSRYKVATDRSSADAVLEGAVTSYRTSPVQFTSGGRATRVEAVVEIQATMRDTSTDEVLWSQGGLIFREQFDVPEAGEFFDQETLALDEIAEGVAGALVTAILEDF